MQVVTDLVSCLQEIISTSLQRFEQMGFVETRAYATKKGSTTMFLTCPAESKGRIQELYQKILQHRKITD